MLLLCGILCSLFINKMLFCDDNGHFKEGCNSSQYSSYQSNFSVDVSLWCMFTKGPFTRYNRLSNYANIKLSVVKPDWQPVRCLYTRQPVVRPVVKLVWQPFLTTGCIVYTDIQPAVKPVKTVWQQLVSCKRGLSLAWLVWLVFGIKR